MKRSQPFSEKRLSWFPLAFACVFLFSLALRFWGLSRFNAFVFDEVYFAKFANNYLTQTQFFDGHPPLAKYIIALGIWIGSHLPFGSETQNSLTGSLRTTWSYRWLNALTGSFIPLVVGAIAWELSRRRSYALIAAGLAAADGLFLVESRYALVNVYLVLFGLLGHYYFLRGAVNREQTHWNLLSLSGIFFGLSAAIKWNGLGFLLGAYGVWIGAKVWRSLSGISVKTTNLGDSAIANLSKLNLLSVVVNLAIVPALVYSLIWIPHIQLNPKYDFWEVHQQIFSYHERLGTGKEVHPYCSNWLSWPFTIRPVLYWYKKAGGNLPADPSLPSLPENSGKVIYAVHAMGNPILWWFSTVAIALLLLVAILRLWGIVRKNDRLMSYDWILIYISVNYLANWLPWAKVTRCLFLYHYMESSVFAGLGLAWLCDRWLLSDKGYLRGMGIGVMGLVAIAFLFWMPVYLGLPLTPTEWQMRMWLRSWY